MNDSTGNAATVTHIHGGHQVNGDAPVTLDSRIAVLSDLGTDTSLILPPGLPYDTWAELMATLYRLDKAIQWWIGDGIRYGELTYGEVATASFPTGHSGESAREYARVADRIEPARRLDDLSFSHHQAVAALEPDAQDRILAEAKEGGWNVHRTRAHVRREKADGPTPGCIHDWVLQCRYCGETHP